MENKQQPNKGRPEPSLTIPLCKFDTKGGEDNAITLHIKVDKF